MRTLKLKELTFEVYSIQDIEAQKQGDVFMKFRITRQDFFNETRSITLTSPKNPKLFYNVSTNDSLLVLNGKIQGTITENLLNILFNTGQYSFLGGNKKNEDKTSIIGIVANSDDSVIGYRTIKGDDLMPWGHSLKGDLKHFKSRTSKNIVIMGRRTFESIGEKPLPNRLNIVVSSLYKQSDFSQYDNIKIIDGVHDAVFYAQDIATKNNCDIYIMGGAMIYDQTVNFCTDYIVTQVHNQYENFLRQNAEVTNIVVFPTDKLLDQFVSTKNSENFEEDGIEYSFWEFVRRKGM